MKTPWPTRGRRAMKRNQRNLKKMCTPHFCPSVSSVLGTAICATVHILVNFAPQKTPTFSNSSVESFQAHSLHTLTAHSVQHYSTHPVCIRLLIHRQNIDKVPLFVTKRRTDPPPSPRPNG
jgi:hypothetical protein